MTPEHDLNDEEYQKALGQYRFAVRRLLQPLRLYGMWTYCDQAEEYFVDRAIRLHMRLMGQEIPIDDGDIPTY
jgi:transcription initiation factor IIE alpha subunit